MKPNRAIKTFWSSLPRSLLRKALLKGMFIAFFGILVFALGGIFMPSSALQFWGFFLFIIAIALIRWGLHPYKQLLGLETTPHKIIIDEQADFSGFCIHLIVQGKEKIAIPEGSIERLSYFNGPEEYGILAHLKTTSEQKILVHDLSWKMDKLPSPFSNDSLKAIYLPYFSQRTFDELRDWISSEEQN